MAIKHLWPIALLLAGAASAAHAIDHSARHGHGDGIFHAVTLETDIGRAHGKTIASWDLNGWIGGDEDKLWIKSEGKLHDGKTDHAELWVMGSRAVDTYWDVQAGIRQDMGPHAHSYLVGGLNGLAPYFIETEAHLFLRDDGRISARLHSETDLLLTNRLISTPYAELRANSRSDHTEALGSGLTDLKLGLQTRYEFSRAFAPYLDLRHEQKLGTTADYARTEHEHTKSLSLNLGIRWLF